MENNEHEGRCLRDTIKSRKLVIADVAKDLGISRSLLHKLFKKEKLKPMEKHAFLQFFNYRPNPLISEAEFFNRGLIFCKDLDEYSFIKDIAQRISTFAPIFFLESTLKYVAKSVDTLISRDYIFRTKPDVKQQKYMYEFATKKNAYYEQLADLIIEKKKKNPKYQHIQILELPQNYDSLEQTRANEVDSISSAIQLLLYEEFTFIVKLMHASERDNRQYIELYISDKPTKTSSTIVLDDNVMIDRRFSFGDNDNILPSSIKIHVSNDKYMDRKTEALIANTKHEMLESMYLNQWSTPSLNFITNILQSSFADNKRQIKKLEEIEVKLWNVRIEATDELHKNRLMQILEAYPELLSFTKTPYYKNELLSCVRSEILRRKSIDEQMSKKIEYIAHLEETK